MQIAHVTRDLMQAEHAHTGKTQVSNGANSAMRSNFCRNKCTNRSAASGFPPSDFKNNATLRWCRTGPINLDIAMTSFWQIEPPLDTQ